MPELLHDWVRMQSQLQPDRPAVVGDDQALTYSGLEVLSNRIAHLLKDAGCERGDRVCLLMPKTAVAIAALLGIYKSDCIYVPADPASPAARLSKILTSCQPKCILTAAQGAQLLDDGLAGQITAAAIKIGWMERSRWPDSLALQPAFCLADVEGYSDGPPASENKSDDAAHILFTSGSTGTPKGVVISHGNVIAFIEWAVAYFGIKSDDRNSGHPPLTFDLSFLDLFATFAAGAELHPVPPSLNASPLKVADFIRERKLTQWFSVPSLLHYMARFDVVRQDDFPHLKRLLWCGEVFPTTSLIHWMRKLPHVQFTNLYGPTETTIASSYYTIPAVPNGSAEPIPIGTPCGGEELLVVDESLMRVPAGQTGELCIRGAGLSRGYWNDAENTARAFVRDPESSDPNGRIYRTGDLARMGENGLVYFIGRKDTQIKSRGYRIELGEIEAALNSVEGVREGAIVAVGNDDAVVICCAFVPSTGGNLSAAALRSILGRSLPGYMLPLRWRAYEALPKNSSGKIDRRILKEHFGTCEARASAGAPPTYAPAG
jgi:amino acid adenylation domain-containing protein